MSEKKDVLVSKAVAAGLGAEKFLSSLSETNLETMVAAIDDKNSEIKKLENAIPKGETKPNKVTTVADLVAKNKISVNQPAKEEE